MNVFDLMAVLTLDSSEYEKGLSVASTSATSFGDKLGSAMKTGVAAVAAVTAAVTALTGALVAVVGKTAEYGDTIDKQSQKLGMSAQAYQEWDAILQHNGTSIDAMSRGMMTLSRQAESNSAAFEKLGITQQELATMNQEELFARTIEGLQGMEAGTERTALAQELLGGSAKELGPLLNSTAEETEAMRQKVHDLGGVMSDEAVKAAAAYQDSLQDMMTALSGASRGITTEFLPSITLVMDGLTELFSGGDGIGKITEGINQFVAQLSSVLPNVMSAGSQILVALGNAIIQNLPVLVQAATQAIMVIGQGLIQQLPLLVESALQIVLMLAQGIGEALPELIPIITDVMLQIVDTLIENIDLLIDAALQIMIGLAEGLIAAIPELLAKAPEIIAHLVTAIIEAAPQLLSAAGEIISQIASGIASFVGNLASSAWSIITEIASGIGSKLTDIWQAGVDVVNKVIEGAGSIISTVADIGSNIVSGIWDGISAGYDWIVGKISGWVDSVIDFIKNALGISSPSKVMRDQVGKYLAQGVGIGFVDEMAKVEAEMQNAIPRTFDVGATINANGYATTATTAGGDFMSELRGLREDIRNLGIYLDTGVLVGAVNDGLGQLKVSYDRRVLA